MKLNGFDFWGMTANTEVRFHIQSYFFVFSAKVFLSDVFRDFILNITRQKNVWKVIAKYEIPLTHLLQSAGFTCSSYIPVTKDYPYIFTKCIIFPVWLLENQCPLIKTKVFKTAF